MKDEKDEADKTFRKQALAERKRHGMIWMYTRIGRIGERRIQMRNRDRHILMRKGFNIFRVELSERKTIVQATPENGWKVYGKYETMAACKRAWDKLMEDESNIED